VKAWSLFDTVEWLLRECRDKGAVGADAVPVTISLVGSGSEDQPPGEAVREALDYCRKQAFEFFPDGWVRLHGGSDPTLESEVAVYITKQGRKALENRERSRRESEDSSE